MSQDALAKASAVSRASITSIERGQSNPKLETLEQLAIALDVDLLALISNGPPYSSAADDRSSLERVARNVNRLRAALGVSQQTLSERSQHFRTYIGNLERQAVSPSMTDVEAIAAALEVGIEALLTPLEPGAIGKNMQKLVRKTRKPA
jgi:transcriptional regulator with XRE-family HTH domain